MTYHFKHDGGNEMRVEEARLDYTLNQLFRGNLQKQEEARLKIRNGGTVKRMGWTIKKEQTA